MSLRDGPIGDIKPPLAWLALAALAVAAIAALAIFAFAGPAQHGSAVRRRFDTAVGSATGVLSAPPRWIGGAFEAASAYVDAGGQNRRLRGQLAQARTLEDQNLALKDENVRLRALLGVRTDPPLPMVAARTVLDARGPFSNSRIADAGAAEGVIEGNPALSEHGLLGRVAGVGPHVSRIVLLTDPESRVPVLIGRTNGRAILTGDGGPSPRLDYLRTHDQVREGDRVLTSGDGGVIPRGVPVGAIVRGVEGWRVALDSDAAPIDFVRILLFRDFAQLASALPPATLPPLATAAPQPKPPPMAVPVSGAQRQTTQAAGGGLKAKAAARRAPPSAKGP